MSNINLRKFTERLNIVANILAGKEKDPTFDQGEVSLDAKN